MPFTKRIIPCLDVTTIQGIARVVKGMKFINLRDAGDPVELGAFYDEQKADELVFLDITASSDVADDLFLVEDTDGVGDTTPFVITADGEVGIGTTVPDYNLEITAKKVLLYWK